MDSLPWFHIERATREALGALADMTIANIAEEQANWSTGERPPEQGPARRAIETALFGPEPAARAFVAIAEGTPIGMAYVSELFPGRDLRRGWFLKLLYVSAPRRGKGVGSALIRHVRHAAEEAGAERLELHTHPDNEGARRLYQRLGMNAPPRIVYRYDL
ncbi:MAG: GNAT family N-acetyltransferase [Neomegalonema sp.]|nr:GNAT family N-acetyltransferase [Neomegalonema sp.]